MRQGSVNVIAIVAASFACVACGDSPVEGGARGTASIVASPDSVPASASASAAPEAKAPTVAFLYSGSFDAKKRKIRLPSGVVDPMWELDKGKKAVGVGQLELSLWSDGRLTGKASGSLGDLTIEGNVDDKTVSASLAPAKDQGFSGVLSGTVEGDVLRGHLNAASSDATIVREAEFELRLVKPGG